LCRDDLQRSAKACDRNRGGQKLDHDRPLELTKVLPRELPNSPTARSKWSESSELNRVSRLCGSRDSEWARYLSASPLHIVLTTRPSGRNSFIGLPARWSCKTMHSLSSLCHSAPRLNP
jgi:hypothetical protein